ncbi:MAG: peroxiredoxin-like family protein [Chitinophagales bacterium]|nr:peroxiredoxin-like family protein [Chitinophagales bacterium]
MTAINLYNKPSELTGLQTGATAPDFSARDQNNRLFNLYETLNETPVVLIFYRGHWCPFCNHHLKKLQDSLPLITGKGVRVVAVSPENSEFIQKTLRKTKAGFTLLYDEDYKIATAYQVNFRPGAVERLMYNAVLNAQMKKSHSDDTEQLPIPATYIISKDKTIKWRHFNPDYKKRSKISDILKQL